MTDEPDEPGANREEERRGAAERARRRARVFGDVLPDATSDDRPPAGDAARQRRGADADDEWLRANVPPHHGA